MISMIQHKTVCCIIEKDGKILLIKRATPPFIGCWCLPGGHVDEGESEYQACVREMSEEVGDTKVDKEPLFDFVHDSRVGQRHHAYVFRGQLITDFKNNHEVLEHKWFSLEEMKKLDIPQWTLYVLNRIYFK